LTRSLCPDEFSSAFSACNSLATLRHESGFADEEARGAVASERLHILARDECGAIFMSSESLSLF